MQRLGFERMGDKSHEVGFPLRAHTSVAGARTSLGPYQVALVVWLHLVFWDRRSLFATISARSVQDALAVRLARRLALRVAWLVPGWLGANPMPRRPATSRQSSDERVTRHDGLLFRDSHASTSTGRGGEVEKDGGLGDVETCVALLDA